MSATIPAIASAAATSETAAAIVARGRVIVGVKTDYDGIGFLSGPAHAGVEVDLARYVAVHLLGDAGSIEFVPVIFANRTELLLAGRIDLIIATMVTNPERLKIVDASIPYLRAGGGTLLAPKGGPVRSWGSCAGQSLAGLDRAYFNQEVIARFGAEIIEFFDAAGAYKALAGGQCAAMVFDEILLRRKVLVPEWTHYEIVGEPLQHHYHQIGLRHGNASLRDLLDGIIRRAQEADLIVGWLRQHGLRDAWSEEQARVLRASIPLPVPSD